MLSLAINFWSEKQKKQCWNLHALINFIFLGRFLPILLNGLNIASNLLCFFGCNKLVMKKSPTHPPLLHFFNEELKKEWPLQRERLSIEFQKLQKKTNSWINWTHLKYFQLKVQTGENTPLSLVLSNLMKKFLP